MRPIKILCLTVISIIILIISSSLLSAQPIDYSYNESGSRTRKYVTLKSSSAQIEENADINSKSPEDVTEKLTEKIMDIQITIFPNPTPGQLNVEVKGSDSGFSGSYQVFNQNGTLLDKRNVLDTFFLIEFSNYPKGIYILKLMVAGNTSVWHIIKQ